MSRFRLVIQTAVALAGLGSAAQATVVSTTTQTLTFGPQLTEFGGLSQPFSYFDSNLGTLQSITFNSSFGFTSQVTVQNGAATSSNGSVKAEGFLIMSAQNGGVNAVVQSALNTVGDAGPYTSFTLDVLGASRTYALAPNLSTVLASNSTTHTLGTTVDSAPLDLLPFEVAGGGATNMIANTFTQTDLSNNGGNTSSTEATHATATFSIFYTYDDSTATPPSSPPAVPEPASLALLGVGVLGAGLVRRRSKSQK
jgi:hypothetical protein